MLELKKDSREQRVIVPGMQRHPQLCGQKCPGAAGARSEPRVELRGGGAGMGGGKMGFTPPSPPPAYRANGQDSGNISKLRV